MKLQVSLAHFRLRCPSVVYVLLDYPVMDRQLPTMASRLADSHRACAFYVVPICEQSKGCPDMVSYDPRQESQGLGN